MISKTFSINIDSPTQGISSLSGSFAFDFDDSVVTGSGGELFDDLALSSVNLSTSIGSTTFTTSNTGGFVYFENGILQEVGVGGAFGAGLSTAVGISTSADDFLVVDVAAGAGYVDYFFLSVASISGRDATSDFDGSREVSFSDATVPAPATLALLGLGLLGLTMRRKT